MIWPFRKRTPPTPPAPILPDQREWNEDWAVGDIAECINDDWYVHLPGCPKIGDRLIVSAIAEGPADNGTLIYALKFRGKPSNYGWATQCFRKVTPPAIEKADEAFIADLNKRLHPQPATTPPAKPAEVPA